MGEFFVVAKQEALASLKRLRDQDGVIFPAGGRAFTVRELVSQIQNETEAGREYIGRFERKYEPPEPRSLRSRLEDFLNSHFGIGLVLALVGIGLGVVLVNGATAGIAILELLSITLGGSIVVVILLSEWMPSPCIGANMLFLFWWLPFLGGCWLGAIGRWAWLAM